MFKRIAFFIYGTFSYLVFLGTFLYAIGFVGNFGVPTTLDGVPSRPLGIALAIDVGLLGLFATQHSVMARAGWKQWWTSVIPPALERSLYVLLASALLLALFWLWQPIPTAIWEATNPLFRASIYGVCLAGWAIVVWPRSRSTTSSYLVSGRCGARLTADLRLRRNSVSHFCIRLCDIR